jgi:hypothetical protein
VTASAFGLYCANKEKMIMIFSKSFKQCTFRALVSGAFLTAFGAATGVAQDMSALSMIIARVGEVRVGTKCDDPPEGFMNNAGFPIGVDVSMAHEIANMRLAKRPRQQSFGLPMPIDWHWLVTKLTSLLSQLASRQAALKLSTLHNPILDRNRPCFAAKYSSIYNVSGPELPG